MKLVCNRKLTHLKIFGCQRRLCDDGMTLIEMMIVIAVIALIYTVAMPQINIQSGFEVSTKLGQVASDVRSASDMAILTNKTYRLVFMMASGDYWLEAANSPNVYLGDATVDHDPTEEEEKYAQELFDSSFQKYEYLAGETIKDPETGKDIKPTSPIAAAKKNLAPTKWQRVQNLEWSRRSIGPYLTFVDARTEHHLSKQMAADLGSDGRFFLYFLAGGYVEPAALHVALKNNTDDPQSMYTIKTKPYEGIAEVVAGYEEYDY